MCSQFPLRKSQNGFLGPLIVCIHFGSDWDVMTEKVSCVCSSNDGAEEDFLQCILYVSQRAFVLQYDEESRATEFLCFLMSVFTPI